MPKASRILILHSKDEPIDGRPYVVRLLADEWRRQGLEVEVADELAESTGPDVLVIPHIDMTVIPPDVAAVLAGCERVINREVTDISKRVVSRKIVTSPDEYFGPVIVKTDRNYGGLAEIRAEIRASTERADELNRALLQQHWSESGLLKPANYQVFRDPRQVPPAVWSNASLIVEKFLPEMQNRLYCLRQYVFLGDREITTRSLSTEPIVKARTIVKREVLDGPPPPAVREVRERFGFDFGKFDYVMNGDEAIVFDINRTPSYDAASKAGSASPLIVDLARGIEPFLG